MNLAQIAEHACLKIGLTDATTVALAKRFCVQRYSLLWDNQNWRQSLAVVQQTVTAGTSEVTLPAALERVTAVRFGDQLLTGFDHGTVLRLMPSEFENLGTPIGFIELPTDDNLQPKIQLLQRPSTDGALYVLAKRRCPGLPSDTSVPMISGAANTLCEAVLGDLWEWQQQFTKGQVCFARAATLLQDMIDTERQQSATVQRFVPDDGIGSGLTDTDDRSFLG